jgi:hypothetical protein
MATIQRQQTTSGGSVAGLLNAPLPGPHVFDGWCVIMSDFLPLLLACTWWRLLVSCFIIGRPFPVLDQYSRSSH